MQSLRYAGPIVALPTLHAFLTAGLDRDLSHQVSAMLNREDCQLKFQYRSRDANVIRVHNEDSHSTVFERLHWAESQLCLLWNLDWWCPYFGNDTYSLQ